MNILVVGAGSIGKVYGYHLAKGGEANGTKVSFFVKEKYANSARKGFCFYPLNQKAHREVPIRWNGFTVLTTLNEVKTQTWDFVVLGMSSPALRSGWLEEFIKSAPSAVFVSLQPGLVDHDYLLTKILPNKLIEGTIHILSYETPTPVST